MINAKFLLAIFFLISTILQSISTQQRQSSFNPSILQDSRDLPKVDGTFGFLYRTEDGIAHAAKGDADGVIHGRFTYTDPTGLKVNYNYNAGSRVVPGYNYNDQSPPPARQSASPPPPPPPPAPRRYQEDYYQPPRRQQYKNRGNEVYEDYDNYYQ